MTVTTLRAFIRVLCFAGAFFLIFDASFILFRPFDAIEPHTIYGSILPTQPSLFDNKWLDAAVGGQPLPLEALFAANVISRPKAADEFRVAMIGDSSTLGIGDTIDQTTAALLTNKQGIVAGKRIVAYNLGWPTARLTKDLLIADAALDYHPDLFIWLVTPLYMDQHMPENQDDSGVIEVNGDRLAAIAAQTGLNTSYVRAYAHATNMWWQHSILFERSEIYAWIQYQIDGFYPSLLLFPPVDLKTLDVTEFNANLNLPDSQIDNVLNSDDWAVLLALPKLTSVPILIVNEPIQIVPDSVPGSAQHYDKYFGKVVYDGYHTKFNAFCQQNQLWCLDLWSLVPPQDYTDTPLHKTVQGNALIVDKLLAEVTDHYSSTRP